MTVILTFVAPDYQGGRILMRLGTINIGAIFQPGYDDGAWHWHFWLGTTGSADFITSHAKTELAAKNAMLSKAREWLQKAGIECQGRTDEAEITQLKEAAVAVEDWWVSTGQYESHGAPVAIFQLRSALKPKP